jgi:integrase
MRSAVRDGYLRKTPCVDIRLPEGVPISEVSRWLGHKSITTTVDLYGHLVSEASARARDALDKHSISRPMCPESALSDHDLCSSAGHP